MSESRFPPGTSVSVTQTVRRRGGSLKANVGGVVEAWDDLPTGSWHAHGKGGRLWLRRLKLRKADGEVTLLVINDGSEITGVEAANG